MPLTSDLQDILDLRGYLLALPEGTYALRSGEASRHPAGIYNLSLDKVLQRMRALTETFSPTMDANPKIPRDWQGAMSALEALFIAVDSYADNVKTVLEVAAPRLAYKSLGKVGRQIDDVFEDLVGRPINRVKHNGDRFELCYCGCSDFIVYGYFVTAIDANGAAATSLQAHGKTGTQWSFNVTLRRLLGQLVQVARMVSPHVPKQRTIPTESWSPAEQAMLRAIATWLLQCAPYCFPNEARIRIPRVDLRNDILYLKLDTLNKLHNAHSRPNVVWTRSMTGDGITRTFNTPPMPREL